MNGRFLLCFLASAAACSTHRHAERAPQVPPLAIEQPQVDLQRDTGSRTDAEPEVPAPMAEVAPRDTTPQSSAPVYRTVTHVVETPAKTPVAETPASEAPEQPVSGSTGETRQGYSGPRPSFSFGVQYGPGYYHGDHYHGGYYHGPGPFLPVHTVIGASVGAAIGSHHGNAQRGAAIGGTVGFFLDLGHMWHW